MHNESVGHIGDINKRHRQTEGPPQPCLPLVLCSEYEACGMRLLNGAKGKHLRSIRGTRWQYFYVNCPGFSRCTNNDPALIVVTRRLSLAAALVHILLTTSTISMNRRIFIRLPVHVSLCEFYDPIRKCGRH